MRTLLFLACMALTTMPLSSGQEIAGAESLRDRSRMLQKKNPMSSETSGFSGFHEATASADAEGVSQYEHLWSTEIPSERIASLSLYSQYNELAGRFGLGAAIKHSWALDAEGKHGVAMELGRNQHDRRFDSLQFLWDTPTESNALTLPNTTRFDVRWLETRSSNARILAQSTFGKTRLFAVSSYSKINDIEERLRLEYKTSSPTQIEDSTVTFDSTRKRSSLRKSPDTRIESAYGIGIEIKDDNVRLRSGAVKRSWERLRPGTFTVQFEDTVRDSVEFNMADPLSPVVSDRLSEQDADRYAFQEILFEDKTTNDNDDIVYIDVDWSGDLKNFNYTHSLGALYREKTRDNFEDRDNFDGFNGTYNLSSAQGSVPVGSTLEGDYQLGKFPLSSLVLSHFYENTSDYSYNQSSSEQDSLSQKYNSYERVLGGYLNTLINRGELTMSAGLRFEKTAIETFGYEIIEDESEGTEITPAFGAQKYNDLFPTLSISYKLRDSSQIAFSRQRTIARPNYYDLIPYRIVFRSSEILRSGNPQLSPTLLDTSTLSWGKNIREDYSLKIGISAIEIQDFIYETEETILDGVYEGFKFRSKSNGTSAHIHSADLSLSRVLGRSFLNGNGITLSLLHQYKESKATTLSDYSQETPLPNVAGNKSRLSLEQSIDRFYWLLQIDYTDEALDQFGIAASTFEYLDKRLTANARVVYKMNQMWSVRLDFINLGTVPQRETIGQERRLGKTTVDSWQSRLDITRTW